MRAGARAGAPPGPQRAVVHGQQAPWSGGSGPSGPGAEGDGVLWSVVVTANERFPIGATVTRGALDADLHGVTARLRASEPVSWIPALDGWLVTRRDLVVDILKDSRRFTVDDPRFAVKRVMGPNMLGVDGPEHARHRDPFEGEFKMSTVRSRLAADLDRTATEIVMGLAARGRADIRRDVAAPLAVRAVGEALGLEVEPDRLLAWYREIADAIATSDRDAPPGERPAAMDHIAREVGPAAEGRSALLSAAAADLRLDEVISNAALLLFGGVETSETMTATVAYHLLSYPDLDALRTEHDLLPRAIDESLRLEPPVVQIDRYATVNVRMAGVEIPAGDLVMLSVAGANRDPDYYPDPDRFDPRRVNARTHVSFAQGPHACIGVHLARAETRAALDAILTYLPGLRLDGEVVMSGSVFRKPGAVPVRWDPVH